MLLISISLTLYILPSFHTTLFHFTIFLLSLLLSYIKNKKNREIDMPDFLVLMDFMYKVNSSPKILHIFRHAVANTIEDHNKTVEITPTSSISSSMDSSNSATSFSSLNAMGFDYFNHNHISPHTPTKASPHRPLRTTTPVNTINSNPSSTKSDTSNISFEYPTSLTPTRQQQQQTKEPLITKTETDNSSQVEPSSSQVELPLFIKSTSPMNKKVNSDGDIVLNQLSRKNIDSINNIINHPSPTNIASGSKIMGNFLKTGINSSGSSGRNTSGSIIGRSISGGCGGSVISSRSSSSDSSSSSNNNVGISNRRYSEGHNLSTFDAPRRRSEYMKLHDLNTYTNLLQQEYKLKEKINIEMRNELEEVKKELKKVEERIYYLEETKNIEKYSIEYSKKLSIRESSSGYNGPSPTSKLTPKVRQLFLDWSPINTEVNEMNTYTNTSVPVSPSVGFGELVISDAIRDSMEMKEDD